MYFKNDRRIRDEDDFIDPSEIALTDRDIKSFADASNDLELALFEQDTIKIFEHIQRLDDLANALRYKPQVPTFNQYHVKANFVMPKRNGKGKKNGRN